MARVTIEGIQALLPAVHRDTVDVRHGAELRVEDLLDLAPATRLVIVDAVSGAMPGTLVRWPLADLAASASSGTGHASPTPRSSHQLPLGLVLGLAGTLLRRQIDGTFLGLAGGSFEFEAGLSDAVRDAIPAFRRAIVEEIVGGGALPATGAAPLAPNRASVTQATSAASG